MSLEYPSALDQGLLGQSLSSLLDYHSVRDASSPPGRETTRFLIDQELLKQGLSEVVGLGKKIRGTADLASALAERRYLGFEIVRTQVAFDLSAITRISPKLEPWLRGEVRFVHFAVKDVYSKMRGLKRIHPVLNLGLSSIENADAFIAEEYNKFIAATVADFAIAVPTGILAGMTMSMAATAAAAAFGGVAAPFLLGAAAGLAVGYVVGEALSYGAESLELKRKLNNLLDDAVRGLEGAKKQVKEEVDRYKRATRDPRSEFMYMRRLFGLP